ncbi:MAG: MATE family efflux transporter [Chloroflexi bacterium]|nr:MATE family efflux transporter [Chloroflexota bacterium]
MGRDWTQGSIPGSLWGLSWPIIISQSLNQMGQTIDMIWVGKLGSSSVAGVGIASMIVMVVNAMNQGIYTALRAMVARAIGSGDEKRANHIAQQSLVITVVIPLVMAAVGVFFAEPLLQIFGVAPEVASQGAAYIRIQFIGTVTMSLRMMTEATMQASGDPMSPMRIAIMFRVVHVVLDPFLIFGWWIFPRMGVQGAALTGIISQGLGGAIGMWYLFRGGTRLRLTLKNFSFDPPLIWRMVRVGLPAMVTGMERTFGNLILMWFVVPFGTVAVAAHSLMQRIDPFVHLPVQGFGQSSGILAGQNLGAKQPERAAKTVWLAVGLTTAVMALVSVLIWFWAEKLIVIFNNEPELVKIASLFLRIEIIGYLVFGLVHVLSQSLNGIGDTVVPMLTTLTTMWLIQVPLAFYLSRNTGLDLYGIRWAIVTAMVMRAIIYTVYFRTGRWKQRKV